MADLVAAVNRALRVRGWSARKASLEAVGHPELVRDLRRGRVPTVGSLEALCDVLDLEFYVGPRRQMGAIDELRLEEAVQSIERAVVANGITLQPEPKARAVVAVYELLDRDREPATAARVKRLIEAFAAGAGDPEDETD